MPINFGLSNPNAFFEGAANMNQMMQGVVKQKAGKKLASGDREGAMKTLQESGDIEGADLLQQHYDTHAANINKLDTEQKKESAQFILDLSTELETILDDPNGGEKAILPTFDHLTPLLKSRGMTDEQLAQYRTAIQQNPGAVVKAFATNAKLAAQRYGFLNTAGGVVQTNRKDGTAVPVVSIDKTSVLPEGATAIRTPGLTVPPQGAAPQAPAPQAPLPEPPAPGVAPIAAVAPVAPEAPPQPAPIAPGTASPPAATVIARGAPKTFAPPAPKDSWADVSTEEMESLGYAPGTMGQRNSTTNEVRVKQVPRAGGGLGRLAPQDSIFLSKLRTEAQQTTNMSVLADRFMTLNKKVETGGALAVPGVPTFSRNVGANRNVVSEMMSITDQITPAMRNGLPGAASDRDVSMFRSATLGVDKPRGANEAVGKAVRAFAARQNDYIAYMEAYATKKGNLLGAQEGWTQYVNENPLFTADKSGMPVPTKVAPWRQMFPELKPEGKAAPVSSGNFHWNPDTGDFE